MTDAFYVVLLWRLLSSFIIFVMSSISESKYCNSILLSISFFCFVNYSSNSNWSSSIYCFSEFNYSWNPLIFFSIFKILSSSASVYSLFFLFIKSSLSIIFDYRSSLSSFIACKSVPASIPRPCIAISSILALPLSC